MARVEDWSVRSEQQWDDLAVATGASPFVRPGWVSSVHQAFLPDSRLVLLTVRHGEELTALMPIVLSRDAARSPTNWHTPEIAMLARDDASARRLAEAALSLPVHRVDLRFLASTQVELFQTAARERGHLTLCRMLQTATALSVDMPWSQWQASLTSNQRRDMRRSTRRLAEHGHVSWHLYDGQDRLDDLLAEGFRVEAAGWKGQAGSAITSRPATTRFYTSVARWAAPRDLLRINVLRLDGHAVAFDLGLQQGGVLYSLKTGYEPSLRACSPGTLNFLHLTEHLCHDELVHTVEMLGHETPWKRRLASSSRDLFHLTAFVHARRRRLHHASARLAAAGRKLAAEQLPEAALDRLLRLRERRCLPWHRLPDGQGHPEARMKPFQLDQ